MQKNKLRGYKGSSLITEDTARLGSSKTSIGFEWEIPLRKEKFEATRSRDRDYLILTRKLEVFRLRSGFRHHFECGGAEIASPVFHNIATARKYSKLAKGFANVHSDYFAPNRKPAKGESVRYECCGIHVHVKNDKLIDRHGSPTSTLKALVVMLHGQDTKDFVFDISGRKLGMDYSCQAQVVNIPAVLRITPNANVSEVFSFIVRQNYLQKINCHPTGTTLEFRIWDANESRLDVALEMSHSLVAFITTRKKKFTESLKSVPTMKQWASWVKKQKGYRVLRNDPAFKQHFG